MKVFVTKLTVLMWILAALTILISGWYLGKEYMRDKICGDMDFYYGEDKDLIKLRACED